MVSTRNMTQDQRPVNMSNRHQTHDRTSGSSGRYRDKTKEC